VTTARIRAVERAVAELTAPGQPYAMRDVPVDGGQVRAWAAGARTLREVLLASERFGDAPFLLLDRELMTFTEHAAAVAAMSRYLIRSAGVGPGDRVAIAMRNLPEFSVAFFATVSIGAVAVPLNAWWTRDELGYALADSGARVAVVDGERAERLGDDVLAGLQAVLVARAADGSRWPTVASVLQAGAGSTMPDAMIDEDALATLFYTSGTTGPPKGVPGTHRNMVSNLLSRQYFRALDAARAGRPAPTTLPRALLTVPLFHVTGAHSYLLPALAAGSLLVLMHKWDVAQALALIERERLTSMGGVPFMALQLLDAYRPGVHDLSSLTGVAVGGAAPPTDLPERFASALPGVVPGNGYGMTETSSVAIYNFGEDYRRRPEATGRVVPIMDARLDQPDATGAGELWLRGANVVSGYWNRPQESARTFRPGGWLRTGDLARIDDEGIVTMVGRSKELIVRGGENIAPAEVAAALLAVPGVRDAAVVGVPDRLLGEQVGAVVQVDGGTDLDVGVLRRSLSDRLAAFKVPARWVVGPGPLPRNPQGKVVLAAVRALLEEDAQHGGTGP
jgi:long-chain acyl-CoA synthetase